MNDSRWNVRLASVDDASELARLLHNFNMEYETPSPGVDVLEARLVRLLAASSTFAILVEPPGEGFALVTLRSNVWYDGLVALLDELYVEPTRRGQGIGSAIMARLMTTSKSIGVDLIEITVDEGDVDAQRFYERLGYRSAEEGSEDRAFYFWQDLITP